MKTSLSMHFSLNRFSILICLFLMHSFVGQASVAEGRLELCLKEAKTPLAKMECFRGLPYRVDGALDEHGRWTIWSNQSKGFASAGLNCSGVVTAISHSIWGQTLSLDEVRYDRLNDSGPNASMGEDWDFGLDLILNLTQGLPRQLIPNPYENQDLDSSLWSAIELIGIDIDSGEFPEMLAQLQSDKIYYFVISKSDARFKGGISFYHVGLILKEGSNIWMYHATAKGGVYRVNLAGESGVAWFRRYYGKSPRGSRYIQLVEVALKN